MATGGWTDHSVEIDGATIRFRTRGTGRPIVFVHGVYVGGSLWTSTAEAIDGRQCIVPTWPLGAHQDPAPGADLSVRAAAARILGFLRALDLHDVTLVANDTGGGLSLTALAGPAEDVARIGRLVLTNCDSYEHFPPKGFAGMVNTCRRVPPIGALLIRAVASRVGRRIFLKGACTTEQGRAANHVFEAFASSRAARRDALTVTRSIEPSVTLDAAPAIPAFDRPVLLVWGDKDKLFPVAHAKRLAADFPNARLQVMEGAGLFVMLDRSADLASAIGGFK